MPTDQEYAQLSACAPAADRPSPMRTQVQAAIEVCKPFGADAATLDGEARDDRTRIGSGHGMRCGSVAGIDRRPNDRLRNTAVANEEAFTCAT
jgi:hypothetical protein